jgi:argininosuccinate lyase
MGKAVREDFSNATDMADYLVKKGLPFRQAHEVVGNCVKYCIDHNKRLLDLSLEEFRGFSDLFAEDILIAIQIETCIAARNSYGGTSYTQNGQMLANAKTILSNQEIVLDMYTKNNL